MKRPSLSAATPPDPFRVGLVALVAGALLAGALVALSVAAPGRTTYTAVLAQTAGLRVGEDVQVAGVSVGEVAAVELGDGVVEVRFTVDDAVELGDRTTAEVQVATLLGTHLLALDPQGSGELPDATIPLDRTSVPFNLQEVLDRGTASLGALDADRLAEALTAAADVLGPAGDDVGPALEGVARLTRVVATRGERAGELLRAARQVTEQLTAGSGDLLALMRSTNLVVAEVTSRRAAIRTLLREATLLSDALTGAVEDTREDLRPALRDLDLVLGALRRQDGLLRSVLADMAPALRYVANATGAGPWIGLLTEEPVLYADDLRCKSGGC